MNLLDWLLVVLVAGLRPLRLLAGLRHRRLRHRRAAARRPVRRLAGPDRPRRRRPVAAGLARRAVHRDPGRLAGAGRCCSSSAPRSATGSPGSRSAPSTRSAAPRSAPCAVLIVAWALGVAVSGSRIDGVTPLVRSSAVLAKVNEVLPAARRRRARRRSTTWSAPASSRATSSRSRRSGSSRSAPGDRADAARPRRRPGRRRSVLKIRGTNDCGRGVEGSGFVYADDRLMTNAHVVAGVDDPEVVVGDDTVDAEVVFYDPDLDIAVLAFDSGAIPRAAVHRQRRAGAGQGRRSRSSATRRTGRSTSSPAGSAPSSAALARHLRRRHGDPRRLLAARAGPARQLRRPDRRLRRATWSAWSSRRRSPTTTPATRSPPTRSRERGRRGPDQRAPTRSRREGCAG